ncbi:hypothetical protein [Natronobacterium texcoconense]|nr:hypothetical protein [Natronobacterium texcoconense]
MTTLSPPVLLMGFCAVMSAVAVWRLAVDDDRDSVDVGTVLVVLGITLGTVLWSAVRESWLTWTERAVIATAGVVLSGIGLTLIVRYWRGPTSGRPGSNDLETSDDRL